jgi:ArsR family transcriptional regulator, arsenate/arsenite/antimonite-responsive transcriptional repressor
MTQSRLCTDQMLHFFKAGGDEHRQLILSLICKHKSLNVNQILEHVKISQPTLSHHLKILREAKFVVTEKRGKEVFYSLNLQNISECCNSLMSEVKS